MTTPGGTYDVVVIGGGPIGLATAYECAKAGKKVLVLEKSIFFNQSGSSGDMVRMFRTAYTEDFMALLAFQSMPLWNALESDLGVALREMSGLLNFGDPKYGLGGPEGTLLGPIPNLEKYGLKYTELTRDQIQAQHPFHNLPNDWIGLDMPDNGVINVALLTRSLHARCQKLGVTLAQYSEATQIMVDPKSVNGDTWIVQGKVHSDKGASVAPTQFMVIASKIAITSGAFVNHVLYPSFGFHLSLDIWEMSAAYYAIDSKLAFPKMWFQFAEDTQKGRSGPQDPNAISNLFYGFPAVPWGPPNVARIAVDAAHQVIKDPHDRSHSKLSPEDLENTRQFCMNHIVGVGPDPTPVFASECLQTNVFDNMFVLDYIPDHLLGKSAGPARSKSISVFTAGWAMKFVPLIGKVLKEMLVDGGTKDYDISHFKMERGDIVQQGPVKRDAPRAATANGSSVHHTGH